MIADVLQRAVGHSAPIRFTAYDGSGAGPADADVVIHVRSLDALRHAATAPGQLGLARAYVSGEMDVDGSLYDLLWLLSREHVGDLTLTDRLAILRELGPGVLKPIAPPPQEVQPTWVRAVRTGLRHARGRDAEVISHHYDVSNRFYELILGPTMVYTCAVYPTLETSLEDAQTEKLDLVCRKLALQPGQRLLDIGCGWGSLAMHAAREYGVHVVAVTLSAEQAAYAQARVKEAGLDHLVEIRHSDYRDVPETGFDAVSSVGLTEHIGLAQLAPYTTKILAALKPGGRLLNHCITRPNGTGTPLEKRGFIGRYVFPDGELPAPAGIIAALEDGGLEVRHEENLREHYAMTLRDWCDNLEKNRAEAVAEVGEATVRVWALYLAGSRMGFDRNDIQLHQVLAVKPFPDGTSGMPLRQDFKP